MSEEQSGLSIFDAARKSAEVSFPLARRGGYDSDAVDAWARTQSAELKKAGVPVFAYGSFITILINFIILAFVIFLMIKQMNRLKREAPPAPPAAPPEDVTLLREIRDALKAR